MAKQDDIVIGLMFGDEGKGTTVDFLSTQNIPASVVRFSGGSQAAHNVILPDGTHHTFAQFGAASLRSIPTTLSRFMMVNPLSLVEEGDLIFKKSGWNPFPSLSISEKCLVTTPIHQWLNRKREQARGDSAHGSCGVGIGETRSYSIEHPQDAITMKDLEYGSQAGLKDKLNRLRMFAEAEVNLRYDGIPVDSIVESYTDLVKDGFLNIYPDRKITRIINKGYHIFEGSQGVLLDEWQGFHPYTTWSETTSKNAQQLLKEAGKDPGKVIGVTRTYLTRHGYGPFPSEIDETKAETLFPESHNTYGTYQGGWRAGWFDTDLFRYAVEANGGVDEISVTHMDRVTAEIPIVKDYESWPRFPTNFFGEDMDRKEIITNKLLKLSPANLEILGTPQDLLNHISATADHKRISVLSYGPASDQKITL